MNEDEIAVHPYAILSHTWGAEGEEVTFEDLANDAGGTKPGYEKIEFCGKQAEQDGLHYFWIDTCCINKGNKAELSQAIQSMFHWYHNAARCYVYLSDVSRPPYASEEEANPPLWELEFRQSKWFTRGWTLQELLAPSLVEFFSRQGKKLGDKTLLKQQIHEATSIPPLALEGTPLSQFSIHERLRWKGDRKTTREEDAWYSLSGIFYVEIAPAYSEGAASAFRRLKEEIDMQERCVQDVRHTDPRDDKKRIEDTKGGLLADSYRWVLSNTAFQQWQQDEHNQLLWVKGDPGKGKTMLLCGIIDELQSLKPCTTLLCYFFCQAIDSRINSATAVLRGLLYMLVDQQPSLISHIRKKYDHAGKTLFEDANSWVALTEIFVEVLRDPRLGTTYLIIDALDECVTDRPKLLAFIAKQSSTSQRVKWIVSSRNSPEIEEQFERAEHKINLSLELNAKPVAAAVNIFIQRKVDQLAQKKQYRAEVRHAVLQHLTSNANDTFLWVALVCQELRATPKWNVRKKLAFFPPGLNSLYKRMLHQISESDGAEICQQVLASSAILYRPVTIPELIALVEQLENFVDDLDSVREIVGLCGSFLTLQEDTVYFVHQSAKDFLFAQALDEVFPHGIEAAHHVIFSRSLAILSRTLHRNMYSLPTLGFPIENVERPNPDPLVGSRYPCIYWIDHLYDSKPRLSVDNGPYFPGIVSEFLKQKYLYWLEALSLCESVGKGVVSIAKLWLLLQEMRDQDIFTRLVQDARRFIMYHKGAIESYPLQAYVSALLFSPTGSQIRQLFQHEEPQGITVKPAMSDNWGACLQTLEGHSDYVASIAFSRDATQLASASYDRTVKIWDACSGACLRTLEGHSDYVASIAFSRDATQLASASYDRTVKIWDARSGACLRTLEGHSDYVASIAFSRDATQLASASYDRTVKIWDVRSNACLRTLEGHSGYVRSITFSFDATQLASASDDRFLKIWDARSGACLQTLKGHSVSVRSVAFSRDATQLASASDDRTIKIWDARSGACLRTLEGHSDYVASIAFSRDATQLASASYDRTIKIWDARSGACLRTLEGHRGSVRSVTFSRDATQLASASYDRTIKIWDARSGACLGMLEGHSGYVRSIAFSRDATQLASASDDRTIKIWDARSGVCLQTFNIGKTLYRLSFDSVGSALYTEIGTILIQSSEVPSNIDFMDPRPPVDVRLGLSSDRIWIKRAGDNMLWIPSEYRPSCSSVCGTIIAMGAGSGRVWSCSINL
ncbi:hypothetical protein DPSP01_014308 [Paraphaeosphaeria sporulosa]